MDKNCMIIVNGKYNPDQAFSKQKMTYSLIDFSEGEEQELQCSDWTVISKNKDNITDVSNFTVCRVLEHAKVKVVSGTAFSRIGTEKEVKQAAEIEALNKKLSDAKKESAKSTAAAEQQKKQMEELNSQISALSLEYLNSIKESESRYESLVKGTAKFADSVEQQAKQMEKLNSQFSALNSEYSNFKRESEERSKALVKEALNLKKENQDLNQRLSETFNSRSWRITRPLRILLWKFRCVFGKYEKREDTK